MSKHPVKHIGDRSYKVPPVQAPLVEGAIRRVLRANKKLPFTTFATIAITGLLAPHSEKMRELHDGLMVVHKPNFNVLEDL